MQANIPVLYLLIYCNHISSLLLPPTSLFHCPRIPHSSCCRWATCSAWTCPQMDVFTTFFTFLHPSLLSISHSPPLILPPSSCPPLLQMGDFFRLDVFPDIALDEDRMQGKRVTFLTRRWQSGPYRDPEKSVLKSGCITQLWQGAGGIATLQNGLYRDPEKRVLKSALFI